MKARMWDQRRHLVVGLVALTLGILASLLWAGRYNSAQADERDDLDLFLDASSAGWAEVVDQFFTVPENAAGTVAALVPEYTAADLEAYVPLLAETIRERSALDAAYVGFQDGSFVFVGRSDKSNDGFRIRIVRSRPNNAVVEESWTDKDLVASEPPRIDEDSYDPTERPWFTPFLDTGDEAMERAWTAPYEFASSGDKGITYSTGLFVEEQVAVVGVDIRLTQMSEFINELRPGANGQSIVFDDGGNVVAEAPLRDGENAPSESIPPEELARLQEAASATPGFGLNASPMRSVDAEYTAVARLAGTDDRWYLVLRAKDSDFLGDSGTSATQKLFGLVAVGVVTAVLAVVLGLLFVRYLGALRDQADRDELTGVLSRRGVKRVLDSLLRNSPAVTMGIIDLDRFKAVNDGHGHPMGDKVLALVAQRIEAFATARDAVAGRLGGDEFVVMTAGAIEWADLSGLLAAPVELEGHSFDIGASIGVATSDGSRWLNADELLREADVALFEVKRSGGGRHGIASDRRAVRSLRPSATDEQTQWTP